MEFIERRPTTETKLVSQNGVGEYFYERSTDDHRPVGPSRRNVLRKDNFAFTAFPHVQ